MDIEKIDLVPAFRFVYKPHEKCFFIQIWFLNKVFTWWVIRGQAWGEPKRFTLR